MPLIFIIFTNILLPPLIWRTKFSVVDLCIIESAIFHLMFRSFSLGLSHCWWGDIPLRIWVVNLMLWTPPEGQMTMEILRPTKVLTEFWIFRRRERRTEGGFRWHTLAAYAKASTTEEFSPRSQCCAMKLFLQAFNRWLDKQCWNPVFGWSTLIFYA